MDPADPERPYRRVYHYHVRKTAGTSLNASFWALAGLDLRAMAEQNLVERDGLVFVRANRALIEEGSYFFANSHRPSHELHLPEGTFTITILRDPLRRLVSLYRYMLWIRDNAGNPDALLEEPFLTSLAEQTDVLGASFTDFLGRVAPRDLQPQLYMFSATYDVDEAVAALGAVDFVGFTETFGADIARLAARLGLPLVEQHERRFGAPVTLTDAETAAAREALARELDFVTRVRPRP